jgi:hypothetical protein
MADRRDHSRAALGRPLRRRTTAIVLHRTIGIDADNDGDADADDVFRFFTRDPEGVATVAVGGSYASKTALIKSWRTAGIPAAYQGAGFCPYHVLVDARGVVTLALDLAVVGAHAGPWNDRSVAVAVIADPRTQVPPPAMVAAVVKVVARLLTLWPGVDVVDHDHVNTSIRAPHKGCIGELFPLASVIADARAMAART